MPLLAKETYLFPPDLLGSDDQFRPSALEDDRPWWTLYTLARNEKSLMRKLLIEERRFYCPVIAKRRRIGSSVRTSYQPLFPSYVFLQGGEEDRHRAVCTGLVSRCLPIMERRRFVEQMRSIQLMIDSGLPLEPELRLRVGARVRVTSGPLKGLAGQIVKSRGQRRFIVTVEFLQQGASTVLDDWELEQI